MKRKIKILHLEDAAADAELIARELKTGKIDSEILLVDDKVKFEKALKDFLPDVILCDHRLHSFDSHEALQMVKKAGLTVPFILVTASMTDEFAVAVMKDGAHDYIIKDRLHRLPLAVTNSIEKRSLEVEQQCAHERLVFHTENTPLGFIEWDNRGFVKSWSKRAEEIFGWSEKEFIENQKKAFSQVYKEDIPWVNKLTEQLIRGEVVSNKIQLRNITKDRKVIWCEWFNSVLKDEDGNVKTIISLVQDITNEKLLERQKDDFLSIASHELNTPVTTIKVYGHIVERMLEEKGDLETMDMIKRMSSQINKLANLIRDLLDITRIQNGKLTYNEGFFDFNELLQEVIDDMQKINPTHKIKNNSGRTETIFGDKDKIAQVLNNLISNAIKYSPKAASIIVSTELQKDGIKVSVKDFGIGILARDHKNIFQQFYRVTGNNQGTFPGLGIGLYICSEIIKREGGKIWVESIINKGSTFNIWLPFDYRNINNSTAIVDIIEYKKDEEYNGNIADIVEFSDDAIISKSLDGTIKSWNKSSEKMFGYTAKQAIGKNISLIIPLEYINEEKKIIERIRDNEIIEHYETVRSDKNGKQFYVSLTVSPLKDQSGNIIGVSKIARDITFLKKSEEELIHANKELVFQNEEKEKRAAELILANKELAFQNEEKEKRAAELIIANKELAFQNEEKEKRAAELIIANRELAFQNEEKEKRAGELNIANRELAFQNEEKEKRSARLTIANKELAFQNKEKEKRAAELTIAQQKVIERSAQLESVNKELESFSYSVSHDLRAPLRAVHGYVRILKEDYGTQLDSEAGRLMNNIVSYATKMGQLIDDLLAFSRLGRKEFVKVNIQMNDIVINLCREINNEEDNRDIQFKISELEPAHGDSITIKQVWVNLISNAVKYSKQRAKAIIEISSKLNGDEIIYSIKDNGAGFDMRYADKLFGVFQRLHTEKEFQGTGVGLAIVHRIISKHGGKVWAEGKVNEGSVFYFTLQKS
jgi:PAS domain S-box-containing protein